MCNAKTLSQRKQRGTVNALLLVGCAITTANGLSYRDGRITDDDASISDNLVADAYQTDNDGTQGPLLEEWNVVQRNGKGFKPSQADVKPPQDSSASRIEAAQEAQAAEQRAPAAASSWAKIAAAPKAAKKLTATMKAKARIVAQAAADIKAKASSLERPRLALKSSKGVGSQPRLARGPDKEGIGFALIRTLMKSTPLAASKNQPLQSSPLEQSEQLICLDTIQASPSPKHVRRVSWGDEQGSPLSHVQIIENCLDEKWEWSNCTDLSTTEGRYTMLAGAAWYGMIALGVIAHSFVY